MPSKPSKKQKILVLPPPESPETSSKDPEPEVNEGVDQGNDAEDASMASDSNNLDEEASEDAEEDDMQEEETADLAKAKQLSLQDLSPSLIEDSVKMVAASQSSSSSNAAPVASEPVPSPTLAATPTPTTTPAVSIADLLQTILSTRASQPPSASSSAAPVASTVQILNATPAPMLETLSHSAVTSFFAFVRLQYANKAMIQQNDFHRLIKHD